MQGWVCTGVVALFILKTLRSLRGDQQHDDRSQNNQENHNPEHRECHPNHCRSFAPLSLRVRAWSGRIWSLFLPVDGTSDYGPWHSMMGLDRQRVAGSNRLVCSEALGPSPLSRRCRSSAGTIFTAICESSKKHGASVKKKSRRFNSSNVDPPLPETAETGNPAIALHLARRRGRCPS